MPRAYAAFTANHMLQSMLNYELIITKAKSFGFIDRK